jgi:integrase
MNLAGTNGGSAANYVRASVSALFTWAMQSGLVEIESNLVAGTPKPAKKRSRERTLSPDELRDVWAATSGNSDYEKIVRLLILTGARRAEIAGMAWPELNLKRAE